MLTQGDRDPCFVPLTVQGRQSCGLAPTLGEIGITITAEDLFDLSMLNEIFLANPGLITG